MTSQPSAINCCAQHHIQPCNPLENFYVIPHVHVCGNPATVCMWACVTSAPWQVLRRTDVHECMCVSLCPVCLQLSDIKKTITKVPTAISDTAGGSKLLAHELFTNDVLYAEAALDMSALPAHLLPLVPLFCRSLTQVGGCGRGGGRSGQLGVVE